MHTCLLAPPRPTELWLVDASGAIAAVLSQATIACTARSRSFADLLQSKLAGKVAHGLSRRGRRWSGQALAWSTPQMICQFGRGAASSITEGVAIGATASLLALGADSSEAMLAVTCSASEEMTTEEEAAASAALHWPAVAPGSA